MKISVSTHLREILYTDSQEQYYRLLLHHANVTAVQMAAPDAEIMDTLHILCDRNVGY
jgi:hypothetical protein